MTYAVGIDVGTTFTAAAVSRGGGVEPIALTTSRVTVPSVVFADGAEVLFGGAAERRGAANPDGLAREFKRRVGDPVPLMLSGSPYHADRLTALMATWVLGTVAEQLGGPPDHVVFTHPANWTEYQLGTLRNALAEHGLDEAELVSEPAAAAIDFAAVATVPPGSTLLVYDLGGGTFDVALLRHEGSQFDHVVDPSGIERLGGIDFDEAVFQFALDRIPRPVLDAVRHHEGGPAALVQLKRRCVEAKEALSSDVSSDIPVILPEHTTSLRITRGELEAMIRPSIQQTIELVRRTIDRAGIEPDELHAALLVGGSSRIPLVSQLVADELQVPVRVDAHPKLVTARGAARLAALGVGRARQSPKARRRSASGAPVDSRPRRSRRVPLLIAGAAVVAAAVVGAVVVLGGGDGETTSTGTTTAVGSTIATSADEAPPSTPAETAAPASAAPTTVAPFSPYAVEQEIATLASPIDLEVVGSDLWVMSRDAGTLQRFDLGAASPTVTATVPLGFTFADGENGNDVVAAGDALFVTQRDAETVARVDLGAIDRAPDRIAVPGRPLNAAVLGNTLWVTVHTPPDVADRGYLVPIAVATGEVGEPLTTPEIPYGVLAVDGELWVTFDDVDQVGRVDVGTGEIELIDGFDDPIDLLALDGDVWVVMSGSDQLAVVDPSSMQIRRIVDVGFIPWKFAAGMGSIWVVNVGTGQEPGTVSRIDATTFSADALQEPVPVQLAPIELAIADGRVFVANLGSSSVSVLAPT